MTAGLTITVVKNDHAGHEVWRYTGRALERNPASVTLEAFFDRDDLDLGYMTYRRGDRFVETFHADRWYCVFEVHDVDDDRLKGWYCNFGRPARIEDSLIRQDDLALDLYVSPLGETRVLDRDEFDALPLSGEERQAVLTALEELLALAQAQKPPFDR